MTSSHQTTINFDSFVFSDNITKSRIIIKDAKQCFSSNHQNTFHQSLTKSTKHIDNYVESMNTMKSTKYFQKQSLKNKIFKPLHGQKWILGQMTNKIPKKLNRKMIDELSKNELRNHLQGKTKSINPQIIKLQHYHLKTEIQQISSKREKKNINTSKDRIKQNHDFMHYKHKLDQKLPQFQKDLHDQINNFLNNYIKGNSSHLIKPKYHRELYQKLYEACSGKADKKYSRKRQYKSSHDVMNEGIFTPVQIGQKVKMLEKEFFQMKNKGPQNRQQEQLIFAVENNLFFDMEYLLSMNKGLIHTKDKKGNNLLHLAAKSRNVQFFAYLLKKLGPLSFQSKNNLRKTPSDIARLYGQSQIIKLCQNYNPYNEE